MSPTSFDTSTVKDPDVRKALEGLGTWLKRFPDVGYIDPKQLGRDLRAIPTRALLAALHHLVDEGRLQVVYKVVSPFGVIGSAENREFEFTSEEVPPDTEIYDREGHPTTVGEAGEVRPMFRTARERDH